MLLEHADDVLQCFVKLENLFLWHVKVSLNLPEVKVIIDCAKQKVDLRNDK